MTSEAVDEKEEKNPPVRVLGYIRYAFVAKLKGHIRIRVKNKGKKGCMEFFVVLCALGDLRGGCFLFIVLRVLGLV